MNPTYPAFVLGNHLGTHLAAARRAPFGFELPRFQV